MTDWQPIETAPKDNVTHVRGLLVKSKRTGAEWFEVIAGHLDDDGDFCDHSGDAPWRAEDYQWWMPLPPPPNGTEQEGIEA